MKIGDKNYVPTGKDPKNLEELVSLITEMDDVDFIEELRKFCSKDKLIRRRLKLGTGAADILSEMKPVYLANIKDHGLSLIKKGFNPRENQSLSCEDNYVNKFLQECNSGVYNLYSIFAHNPGDAENSFGFIIPGTLSISEMTYVRQEFWKMISDEHLGILNSIKSESFNKIACRDISDMRRDIMQANFSLFDKKCYTFEGVRAHNQKIKELLSNPLSIDNAGNVLLSEEIDEDMYNLFMEVSLKTKKGRFKNIVYYNQDNFYFGGFDKDSTKVFKGRAVTSVVLLRDCVGRPYLLVPHYALGAYPFGALVLIDSFFRNPQAALYE